VTRVDQLLGELDAQRAAFLHALDAVEPDLMTTPGLVEQWSARDLIVHLAFWCDHGTDALGLATAGRGSEFAYDSGDTDAMNARLTEESASMSPAAAGKREEVAFLAFRSAIQALDPDTLDLRLGNGDTVAEVINYDGPEHYEGHTADVRAWFNADGPEYDG
jgi:Mycothiol maleylpyruvate isomerase N-terminal domain